LKIGKEGWHHLSEGIGASKSLKKLQINLCSMNMLSFEILGTGLKSNSSLEIIDFSYNSITDECGGLLAKIV
jgi:hypothetical protein